ncbi:hypothetical protein CQW23_18967 [Capsicum baccatum]|uniref:Ubiquitin-like protease family profile domain-containing protein n=1 Tax=Capsicum baccatum TaxID=33114 RepID=A0A2G2W4H5_CAPBA|nr:hypothetical protein CQW23_18967 [Capsicum baccatum]
MYLTGEFNYQDLMNMNDPFFWFECMHANEILSLMRKRQIWFPRHSNQTDLILDLNFYNILYDQYKNWSDKSLVNSAPTMHEALTLFEMDSNILKYCNGEKPFSYDRKWDGAKRIYNVMNIKNTHFIAYEFLMEKGLVQVYDFNIDVCDEITFLTVIQLILELWPKLLTQSGAFNHLPEKNLNDAWSYERLKDVPRSNFCAACGPYACVFIDHLFTRTNLMRLNDNEVDNFRMRYIVAVIEKELNP